MYAKYFLLPAILVILACNDGTSTQQGKGTPPDSAASSLQSGQGMNNQKGSYAYDASFLQKNTNKVLELRNASGNGKVLLSADYQGRVMTSTARGDTGTSYGWLNYDLIASGQKKQQFNPVGGEERFWLGPEGGQFSIYFKGKDSFTFNNWQVPAIIDTVTYDVVDADATSATFTKKATLVNYSGTAFNLEIRRKITLLGPAEMAAQLETTVDPSVSSVAYVTDNAIKNTGDKAWTKDKGLLSIWLLAMLTPSETTKVIIPFTWRKNAYEFITTDYFGKIPPERIRITDSFLVLNCDGRYRSKVGVPAAIARPVAGSYDFKRNILTITMFSVDRTGRYVNSKWELQANPFGGDVVNAYNDGPLADGTQMGPFYEIESSSPAKELKPGESQVYKQYTFHFEGEYAKLEALAWKVLGVRLSEIK
jgi:uncharacterized protein DUF6786